MPFIPLSDTAEYHFPDGIFDLRGWEVRTMKDGEKAGEIEDLLLDDSGSIRYLDVDIAAARKHVLLPIERARVDEAESVVWVPGLSLSQFEEVPRYDHDPDTLTDEYQDQVAAAYSWTPPPRRGVVRESQAPEPAAAPGRTPRSGPLASLTEMGQYEVVAGDDDPRGWDLVMSDQRRVGKVHDLLIDPAALKVRYLDCVLTAPEAGHPAGGRHILVPIGYTRLDGREKIVYVDAISSAAVTELPSYPGVPLAPEDEDRIHEIFAPGSRGGVRDRG
jgi:hypothetical protein